ncbi:murein biosynthesis integral membrane protein MurJ [Sphingomonas suaedae]|uniref:Probable lipid II flippase MurJ n=1 Tax=Sphingomonas suaedae TaxID=2599297 RepID=A0A518REH6_9SPHN|nr:murein biosynthesis integral membrane protein MurJ [Sphingomonas suaedae]QDX25828.1 murein biosynthesis integral membrane protein MurJ [Sphingomonas suaedae]
MNLFRALGSIGGLTLVSRVLGLVRDSLFARYVGAGFASDAFLIAFRLPNLFRSLMAEGAFSAAFVPLFSRKLGEAEGDMKPALRFAEEALSVLFPVLLVFTIAMEIAAFPVVWMLSGGFNDVTPDQFAYAVALSRITFPYLFFISLMSLLGGILNSLHKFWANAAAPILLNIFVISTLLVFNDPDPMVTAWRQAIAVMVSGAAQLLWLIIACRLNGIVLKLRRPRLSPEVKRLLRLIGPAAAGAGATQINLVISTALAASLLAEGSVSYIYYADRLNQLPLGLIGIGLGTVLLPTIARQLGAGNDGAAMHTQNRGTELALFLTLPAAVALVICGAPIVSTLFQHGAFDAEDTRRTAQALAAFSLGLPAYILVKVLTPGFYARSDTRTPVRFATIAIGINLIGNLALIVPLQHIGPPLATAIAAWVNAGLLFHGLAKRGHFTVDAQLSRRIWRLVAAALAMGGVMYFLTDLFTPDLQGSWTARALSMMLLVAVGGIVYAVACFATGAFRREDLRFLRRRSA